MLHQFNSAERDERKGEDRFSPDYTDRTSMEVPSSTKDDRTTLCYPLLLIRPLSRKLDACLDSFGARVHRQNHFIAKKFRDLLCEDTENGIIEGSGRECQTLSLLHQGCHDAGVAVTLINRATIMSRVSTCTQ